MKLKLHVFIGFKRGLDRIWHAALWATSITRPYSLEGHQGSVSIGSGGSRETITNLRFADDIDGLSGEEEKLAKLTERLDKVCTATA